ncbi:MAG: UDP-N-acetylmuramoyl-L-alanine--D-glutamate ligase [Acidobacteria bacterium]|nr:UDP-N-acetylmuramoyl-L-alanine--D-glutamate ligase [Acidobacteriota bacterium]MCG3194467.1 UDP-N-acetylmuramoylalanine--D-glutamate ligase [Thermoanaerobaculia bacterium]
MSLELGPDLPDVNRAVVVGFGRSGRAACRVLLDRGVAVMATDERPEGDLGPIPEPEGFTLFAGSFPEGILGEADLVVVSPGVPSLHPFLDAARARAIPVISEIELASRLLPGLVIGITGTNGKSTTTSLTADLVKASGRDAIACGNLGVPWISYAQNQGNAGEMKPRVWVVEISSFQLETIRRFAPDTAVILNITPDHMDRYRGFDDYAAAKARILENQNPAQLAILNADDPATARIRPRARASFFSRLSRQERGIWIENGTIFWTDPRRGVVEVVRREAFRLPGEHNTENLLAALAVALPLGLGDDPLRKVLAEFRGLPHRTVLVRERGGVAYVNDSKGTNIDASLKSLEGFPDGSVHLILGGQDKKSDFTRLRGVVGKKARAVYLIGKAAEAIGEALSGVIETIPSGTLDRAVAEAARRARPGDTVLLSPACASFDQFRNFEHRGDVFEALVRALPEGAEV